MVNKVHNLNLRVNGIPDDLYEEIIEPAKRERRLSDVVIQCLRVYAANQGIREAVDNHINEVNGTRQNDIINELNDTLASLEMNSSFLAEDLDAKADRVGKHAAVSSEGTPEGAIEGGSGLDARVASLEGKIDNLVSLVSALSQKGIQVAGEGGSDSEEAPATLDAGDLFNDLEGLTDAESEEEDDEPEFSEDAEKAAQELLSGFDLDF